MKFIKMFENFDDNDFFNQITTHTWVKMDNDRHAVDFLTSEIGEIRSLFNNIEYIDKASIVVRKTTRNSREYKMNICKYEDEWFIIYVTIDDKGRNIISELNDKTFKCDGFEGLITFLKKIKDITNAEIHKGFRGV